MDFNGRNMTACMCKTYYELRPFFNIVENLWSCGEQTYYEDISMLYILGCVVFCA